MWREQCSGLFCRLSASFWDPPFHAPWSNRHRHSTQKEEPPYLVLERKGKGYPRMPAALGHPPAVVGPHPRVQFRLQPAGGGTAQGLGRWPAGKQPTESGAPGVGTGPGGGGLLCLHVDGDAEGPAGPQRKGRANTLFVRESSFPNCFGCRVTLPEGFHVSPWRARFRRRESISKSATRVQGTRISGRESTTHPLGLCTIWKIRFLAHPFPLSLSFLLSSPPLLFQPLREPGGVKRPTFLLVAGGGG